MKPECAVACRTRISSSEFTCSTKDGKSHGSWHGHGPAADYHTEAPCFANNTHFLTSMALCIDTGCGLGLSSWDKEKYWATNIADVRGGGEAKIPPKWMYGEALAVAMRDVETYGSINKVPIIQMGALLNFTGRPDPVRYAATVATNINYSSAEVYHSRYGLITLLVSVAVPILLTGLYRIPYFHKLGDLLSPFLDTSIFRGYSVRILPYWLGNAPTVGQASIIIAFIALNIVASGAEVKTIQPHTMFTSHYINRLVNLGNRTGVICFALSPLVLLLAARNNILLSLTDWSHNTWIMMHRWAGRLWVLQAIVHSIVEVMLYTHQRTYAKNSIEPYWIWGSAATIAGVLLLVGAVTWVRRSHYETFLILHIFLAVFTFIASYYHVYLIYDGKRGYEYWLYACFTIWGGDRLLRIWRAVMTGAQHSTVRELGGGIVRVDIHGVRWPHTAGSHGYIYFPTMSWRVWENHPFSVTPTALIENAKLRAKVLDSSSPTASSLSEMPASGADEEKAVQVAVTNISSSITSRSTSEQNWRTSTGMTMYIKKGKSLTGRLVETAQLSTWLEGPYHDRSSERCVTADRLLCIAGGVGITGVLTFACTHANTKLYWSMRESDKGLSKDLAEVMGELRESDVRIGERFDVASLIQAESAALAALDMKTQLGVVVCGPPALCDDVRSVVTRLGRHRSSNDPIILMAVEAFSW